MADRLKEIVTGFFLVGCLIALLVSTVAEGVAFVVDRVVMAIGG